MSPTHAQATAMSFRTTPHIQHANVDGIVAARSLRSVLAAGIANFEIGCHEDDQQEDHTPYYVKISGKGNIDCTDASRSKVNAQLMAVIPEIYEMLLKAPFELDKKRTVIIFDGDTLQGNSPFTHLIHKFATEGWNVKSYKKKKVGDNDATLAKIAKEYTAAWEPKNDNFSVEWLEGDAKLTTNRIKHLDINIGSFISTLQFTGQKYEEMGLDVPTDTKLAAKFKKYEKLVPSEATSSLYGEYVAGKERKDKFKREFKEKNADPYLPWSHKNCMESFQVMSSGKNEIQKELKALLTDLNHPRPNISYIPYNPSSDIIMETPQNEEIFDTKAAIDNLMKKDAWLLCLQF